MSKKAMQQALEALEQQRVFVVRPDHEGKEVTPRVVANAITALKQALAEPEQETTKQKPVAWMDREGDVYKELPSPFWCPPHTPLYAHPPAPRKPLTDEEIMQEKPLCADFASFRSGIRCMERIFHARNMK